MLIGYGLNLGVLTDHEQRIICDLVRGWQAERIPHSYGHARDEWLAGPERIRVYVSCEDNTYLLTERLCARGTSVDVAREDRVGFRRFQNATSIKGDPSVMVIEEAS